MASNALFVEARYALGLINVSDNPEGQEIDVKTRGIQVFAGMAFPLGGK